MRPVAAPSVESNMTHSWAACPCGWRGKKRKTAAEATTNLNSHLKRDCGKRQ